jgi:Protein of unknown function (DUF2752)
MKKNKLYRLILTACLLGYCWLFFLKYISKQSKNIDTTICLFKKITNVPCPSCGTSRAVITIFNGEIFKSILINPFGIIVATIMVIVPIWIVIDFVTKKESFYNFYLKAETIIMTKKIGIPLFLLVIINWIWNIHKHL